MRRPLGIFLFFVCCSFSMWAQMQEIVMGVDMEISYDFCRERATCVNVKPPERRQGRELRSVAYIIGTPGMGVTINTSLCDVSSSLCLYDDSEDYLIECISAGDANNNTTIVRTCRTGRVKIVYQSDGISNCLDDFSVGVCRSLSNVHYTSGIGNLSMGWDDTGAEWYDLYIDGNEYHADNNTFTASDLCAGQHRYRIVPRFSGYPVASLACVGETAIELPCYAPIATHATVYSTSATISWDENTDEVYSICYRTPLNDQEEICIDSVHSPFNIEQVVPRRFVSYRITTNGSQNSPYSPCQVCVSGGDLTALCYESEEFNIDTVQGDAITMSWNSTEEDTYTVFVANMSSLGTERVFRNVTSPFVLRSLMPNESYKIAVIKSIPFYDHLTLSQLCSYRVFRMPCYTLHPTEVALNGRSFTIRWDEAEGVDRYCIRVEYLYQTSTFYSNTNQFTYQVIQPGVSHTIQIYPDGMDYTDVCPMYVIPPCDEINGNGDRCVSFANLSCVANTYTGSYTDPYQQESLQMSGETSAVTSHTAVYTRRPDPNAVTGRDTLFTIPPDEIASVRLGNMYASPYDPNDIPRVQEVSKTVRYAYHVDISTYDLLILKYAVVLAPNHYVDDEAYFDFHISTTDGETISPECNSARFAASNMRGRDEWHTSDNGEFLWRDWSTIAIDLTPYDGRDIIIDLIASDCIHGGHMGYAYYVLKCDNRRIGRSSCGDFENTILTAPPGFLYEWYDSERPEVILSTTDSLYVSTSGSYVCNMTFPNPQGDASRSCSVSSTINVNNIYPIARFDVDRVDTLDSVFSFHFTNHSYVSSRADGRDTVQRECESYEWMIEGREPYNGTDFSVRLERGRYVVRLVSYVGSGYCSDTTRLFMAVPSTYYSSDTINAYLCDGNTFTYHDTVFDSPGTYHFSDWIHDTVIIISRGEPTMVDTTITACGTLSMAGHSYSESGTYTITIPREFLCDSIVTLHLDVRPTYRNYIDTLICDTDVFFWEDMTLDSSGSYDHRYLSRDGCDSTVTLYIDFASSDYRVIDDTCVQNELPRRVSDNLIFSAVRDTVIEYLNPAGCASSINYSLYVYRNLFDTIDTLLCEVQLPMRVNGVRIDSVGVHNITLSRQGPHGEDILLCVILHDVRTREVFIIDSADEFPHFFRDRVYNTLVFNDTFLLKSSVGCDSIVHYTLWFRNFPPICDGYLQFPNFISANDDGVNDRFVIVNLIESHCYETNMLSIYNRWGALVYRVSDIRSYDDFWSPKDMNIPVGTYFYHFTARGPNGAIERNGVVEVVFR